MIKAEDLRVGDLVYVNRSNILPYESVCTIVGTQAGTNYGVECVSLRLTINGWGLGTWGCDDLDGIPLTVEILLANGWKTHAQWPGIYVRQEYGIEVDFDARKKVAFVSIGAETLNKIKYVHEFQHILWAFGLDADMKIPDERKEKGDEP